MQQTVNENRYFYIGGSDIPAIMGISPFKTRYDLLLEKAQLQEDEFQGNEYTEYGNTLEPKIRDYLNKRKKNKFLEDKVVIDDLGYHLRYHSDGYDGTTTLEIKTTSQIHEHVEDYKIYLVQLLFGIWMHKKEKGKLAVYHRPEDFSEEFDPERLQVFDIHLKFYQELMDEILRAVEKFNDDLMKLKDNPFLTEEDLMPNDLVAVANQVLVLEGRLAELKKIEEQSKELKQKLMAAMIESGIKKWTTPNGTQITLVQGTEPTVTTVERFNEKRFKVEHKDLYDEYLTEEAVEKKGRAGYIKITLPKE